MGDEYRSLETEYIKRIIKLRGKLKDLNVIKENAKMNFINLSKDAKKDDYKEDYIEMLATGAIPAIESVFIAYKNEISSLEKELQNLNNPKTKNDLSIEQIKEQLIKREEKFEKENNIESINDALNKIKKPKALSIFEMLEDKSLEDNDDLI